jgi:hypothetical protein
MSKTDLFLRYEKQAVTTLKAKLLREAKNDFDQTHNDFEEGYDSRSYYDSATQTVYYPWIHSKGLTHDATTGFPTKDDVDLLLEARSRATTEAVDAIPLSGGATRKIRNILVGHNYNLIGTDPSPTLNVIVKPAIDSNESAFEMAEVYSKSLLRDVSFWDIEQGVNATANTHITNLNAFPSKSIAPVDTGLITAPLLHRDSLPGCDLGPYVSQVLYGLTNFNPITLEIVFPRVRGYDDNTGSQTLATWLQIQNGEEPTTTQFGGSLQFIFSARQLMTLAFQESPAQTLGWLTDFVAVTLPLQFTGSDNNDAYISGGIQSLHSSIQGVITACASASAHHKWGVNMGLRPEVLAQRYHYADTLNNNSALFDDVPGFQFIKDRANGEMAPFISEVNTQSGSTALLRTVRGNSSPMDPSMPSLWSVVAGACITIYKAYVDCHDEFNVPLAWINPIIHSTNGASIVSYTGSLPTTPTINGELNKLASNLGQAQGWLGEAFRSDLAYELGEAIAIRYLEDTVRSFHEGYDGVFEGFKLSKFDESFVIIK